MEETFPGEDGIKGGRQSRSSLRVGKLFNADIF